MTSLDPAADIGPPLRRWPRWPAQVAMGLVYWLVFLLILEPGNLIRAAQAGAPLELGHEVGRIAVASLMGASVTPLLMALARRFPIQPGLRWSHLLVSAVAVAALAFGLIVASCFPAAWWLEGAAAPTLKEVSEQLLANWPLLIYCMAAFVGLVHAVRARQAAAPAPREPIVVETRGRLDLFDPAEIDWIETQGNYVALHIGGSAHLVRDTLARFEAKLDATRFARIHRRTVVALDRIVRMAPLANGDAVLTLTNGRELRVSRSHRRALADRLANSLA